MKTIIAIFLMLAPIGLAQESAVQLRPITNVVDSPRLQEMRRIHQWQQDRHKRRTTDAAVMDALRWFSSTQNPDGSWGEKDERGLATPLVLLAYLGRGETRASERFGEHVGRAHEWLMSATPTNDPDRIATIIALSEYTALHIPSAQRHLAKAGVAKVQQLLDSIVTTNGTPWIELLSLHLLPQEVSRPTWLQQTRVIQKNWQDANPSLTPDDLDSYLALRLATLGKQRGQQDPWHTFYREYAIELIKHQDKEGNFPCKQGEQTIACTALAVHALEVYGIMLPHVYIETTSETGKTQNKTSEHISEGRERPSENAQR